METKDLDIIYFVKAKPSNEELRYSLRSLDNFPHRKVWFVGEHQPGFVPDGVLKVTQDRESKWQNTSKSMRAACLSDNELISENFVLFNDDFFIMKPLKDGFLPYFYRKTLGEQIAWLEKQNSGGYLNHIRETRKMLLDTWKPIKCYAVHYPMVINKKEMLEVMDTYKDGMMWRALYGNYWKKGGVACGDCKIQNPFTTPNTDAPFLSTTDRSFKNGLVGKYIREQFKNKCEYEE